MPRAGITTFSLIKHSVNVGETVPRSVNISGFESVLTFPVFNQTAGSACTLSTTRCKTASCL